MSGPTHALEALRWSTERGRRYWVGCACGWDSGPCKTAELAVAAGEQHIELTAQGPPPED